MITEFKKHSAFVSHSSLSKKYHIFKQYLIFNIAMHNNNLLFAHAAHSAFLAKSLLNIHK